MEFCLLMDAQRNPQWEESTEKDVWCNGTCCIFFQSSRGGGKKRDEV